MEAIEISPSGVTHLIPDLNENELNNRLGPDRDVLPSQDSALRIHVSKMWEVLDMELNAYASKEAGVVLGGTVILSPSQSSAESSRIFANEFRDEVEKTNSDSSIRDRLALHLRNGEAHRRFQFHPPDRWIYNGKAFKAIVVGLLESSGSEDDEYGVWVFGDPQLEPFTMKIVEFSLYEILSEMISCDLLTSEGNPPSHFVPVARHFALI